jgi:hypothetical protein
MRSSVAESTTNTRLAEDQADLFLSILRSEFGASQNKLLGGISNEPKTQPLRPLLLNKANLIKRITVI